MTKSTSRPANAGLPAIDRRSLVCGLGAATVAGVPARAPRQWPMIPFFKRWPRSNS
jgi:hypothetical protein